MWQWMLGYFKSLISNTILLRFGIISFALIFVFDFPKTVKDWKQWLIFAVKFLCVLLSLIVINVVLFKLIECINLLFLIIVLEYLPVLIVFSLYSIFFVKREARVKTMETGALIGVVVQIMNISHTFGSLIDSIVSGWTIPVLLLVYAIIMIFAIFERKCTFEKFINIPWGGAFLVIVVNTITIIFTFIIPILDIELRLVSVYSTILVVLLLFLEVITYFTIYFICVEREKSDLIKSENLMIRSTNLQLKVTNQTLAELRKIRHDLKNQFSYLGVLLSQKKYEELENAFRLLLEQDFKPEFYIDCGNLEISSILTMESRKAHDVGLMLECTLVVPPKLPFDSNDMCAILSNLTDNAIEAQLKYDIKDPIKIIISLHGDYLYICIKNGLPHNCDEKQVLALKTDKNNVEMHGLGTQIVKKIAAKYFGNASFDIQDGKFIAEVLLDMTHTGDEV